MKARKMIIRTALLVCLTAVSMWSCAGKPFNPPRTGEIPGGPGIFTKGDDGAVLYDSNRENGQMKSPVQAPAAAPSDTGQPDAVSDYEDFQAYRRWQQWKKAAAGTPEYEEFQQWREWRKYKQWTMQQ